MTIGRPRQFDESVSLDKAMTHFWQCGYSSTSMNDLMDCTGLSKSSLYNSFGNKSALFIKCLSRFKFNLVTVLEEQLSQSQSGLQFIRDVFYMVIAEADNSQRMGCMLVNTANELAGRDANIANEVTRGFSELQRIIAKALKTAKQAHEVSDEMDVESTADFILTSIVGLRTMVKSGVNYTRLKQIADRTLDALN